MNHKGYPRAFASLTMSQCGMRSKALTRSRRAWAWPTLNWAVVASSALAACFHAAMSAPIPLPAYRNGCWFSLSHLMAMDFLALVHNLTSSGMRPIGLRPPSDFGSRAMTTTAMASGHSPVTSQWCKTSTSHSRVRLLSLHIALGWWPSHPSPVPTGKVIAAWQTASTMSFTGGGPMSFGHSIFSGFGFFDPH